MKEKKFYNIDTRSENEANDETCIDNIDLVPRKQNILFVTYGGDI